MSGTVTALRIPEPKNHEPSGRPAWPRILLSGEEGARKSWELARMSTDSRLGGMFWLEMGSGETTAEEYGRIPDVRYKIIDHDGTFSDILGQLWAHWKLAKQAEEAGEPPIALGIDSFSGEWVMLCSWLDLLARRREAEKATKGNKPVRGDLWSPDYIPQITPDLWNLANRRHEMLLEVIQMWPGPVGYTAREKLVTVFKDNGQPDPRQPKVWTLEAQKGLGYISSAWLRMTRDGKPMVVKLRSASPGVIKIFQDSNNEPAPWQGDTLNLGELIFDVIGCEAGKSRAPEVKTLNADQVLPGEVIEAQPESGQQRTQASTSPPTPIRQAREPRPSKLTKAEAAEKGTAALLAAATEESANNLVKVAAESIARQVDVAGSLVEARDELKVQKGDKVTLEDLAALVLAYVIENGYSVAEGTKLAKAEEADRPSDHSGGTEHLFGQEGAA